MNGDSTISIASIATSFPRATRTNDDWLREHPDLIEQLKEKISSRNDSGSSIYDGAYSPKTTDTITLWQEHNAPYLSDVFRGCKRRYICANDEGAAILEHAAAEKVLSKASLPITSIDLIITISMFPDDPGGAPTATEVAHRLGHEGAAWSLSATCGGFICALETAKALVSSGTYNRVLLAISGTYSKRLNVRDPMSLVSGDGAAACIIERSTRGLAIDSTLTYRSSSYSLVRNTVAPGETSSGIKISTRRNASGEFEDFLTADATRSRVLLSREQIPPSDIDLAVLYSATAAMTSFYGAILQVPKTSLYDTFPQYGNMTVATVPIGLHDGLRDRDLEPGSRVLLYAHGATGASGAALLTVNHPTKRR